MTATEDRLTTCHLGHTRVVGKNCDECNRNHQRRWYDRHERSTRLMSIEEKVLIRLTDISPKGMTALDGLRWCGTMRLAAVVHSLRKKGHDITSTTVEVRTTDGRTVRVAEYALVVKP